MFLQWKTKPFLDNLIFSYVSVPATANGQRHYISALSVSVFVNMISQVTSRESSNLVETFISIHRGSKGLKYTLEENKICYNLIGFIHFSQCLHYLVVVSYFRGDPADPHRPLVVSRRAAAGLHDHQRLTGAEDGSPIFHRNAVPRQPGVSLPKGKLKSGTAL